MRPPDRNTSLPTTTSRLACQPRARPPASAPVRLLVQLPIRQPGPRQPDPPLAGPWPRTAGTRSPTLITGPSFRPSRPGRQVPPGRKTRCSRLRPLGRAVPAGNPSLASPGAAPPTTSYQGLLVSVARPSVIGPSVIGPSVIRPGVPVTARCPTATPPPATPPVAASTTAACPAATPPSGQLPHIRRTIAPSPVFAPLAVAVARSLASRAHLGRQRQEVSSTGRAAARHPTRRSRLLAVPAEAASSGHRRRPGVPMAAACPQSRHFRPRAPLHTPAAIHACRGRPTMTRSPARRSRPLTPGTAGPIVTAGPAAHRAAQPRPAGPPAMFPHLHYRPRDTRAGRRTRSPTAITSPALTRAVRRTPMRRRTGPVMRLASELSRAGEPTGAGIR